MNCPNCKLPLERKRFQGRETEVDRCSKCAGVWFDDGEIGALVGSPASPKVPPNATMKQAMPCPRCSTPLFLFTYPGTMSIVEGCKTCSGIWLDRGELQEIAKSKRDQMTCPGCGHTQPTAETCVQCGIVPAKFVRTSGDVRAQRTRTAVRAPAPEVASVKGRLIRFIDSTLESLWQGIRR